jgi:hypothetical protein
MRHVMSSIAMGASALALAWAAGLPVATPAQAAKSATMMGCFADLETGTSPDIVCDFPLQPSPTERAEMEKQTMGYLKDATCTVSIKIQRALVTAAIETPDHVFVSPPQPVACKITMPGKAGPDKTGDQFVNITSTFAPKVTMKGGVAVEATPGLGEVKGVSRVIAWPAVAYINRAGFLRTGMLRVVNAWVVHMRAGGKGKVVAR